MIFKTLNYTNEIKKQSSSGGRRQLFKSLRHSLRIPASEPKKLEWFDEQSHLNLIWLPDTGIVKLDYYPKEQREALLTKIAGEAEAPTVDQNNRTELVALRAKLKNTVKNASKKETDEGSIIAFQNILNAKGIVDTEQLLSDLDLFEIKRKSQKLDTARQFLECHNEIERGPKALIRKNQAVIQEAFFKFPSKNEVTGIGGEGRIELIKDFYQQVFPEYPIHFIVLHGDEDVDLTDHSDHPHLFISTKNSKTGRYDLRESQIRKVNFYLKKHRPGTEPISSTPDFLESQLLFGYLQDMFYAYTNNRLLRNTPYFAKKNEKTEGHMNKLRYISGETKKPKSERVFNLYSLAKEKMNQSVAKAELATQQAKRAQQEEKRAQESAYKAEQSAEDSIERQRLAEQVTEDEHEQAASYRNSSAYYKDVMDKDRTEHAKILGELKLFRTNLSGIIEGITNWIEETFAARRQDIQEKYLEQARKAYSRVRENDETDDKRFTKEAEANIDQHLAQLELYDKKVVVIPAVREIKRRIIKP